ncbi:MULTISPECIES: MBL fold metallo-hydrolase [Cobetia]|uniref:MBL fold metallo-hydrolase n=1 Tax=Cobetia crustatorum TaxID=553385 RepID=A0A558HKH9_9GAMM|nr:MULTISPECIES: MBL fold metallo-hydrolase [Cobetia]TVU69568.1 MBL fold metallo-hydrolase [Cobetia crustatorum]
MAPSTLHPDVTSFFDKDSNTFTHLVCDPQSRRCAIIDPVLDFDYPAGKTKTDSADALLAHIAAQSLEVEWILETHVHADHLSAAAYLKDTLGCQLAIGARIREVQDIFADIFAAESGFARDGRQFDRLLEEGDSLAIGALECRILHTPGHTPACVSYVIGDAVFVGDTLFMPDYGTARCDFPGGDARTLYRSIHKVLALPADTRLFLCHDYSADGREGFCCETTVGEQRQHNVHVHEGIDEEAFVSMRSTRDAGLGMPRLMLPAVQVNMRAGQMPPVEANGQVYLKIPLNHF